MVLLLLVFALSNGFLLGSGRVVSKPGDAWLRKGERERHSIAEWSATLGNSSELGAFPLLSPRCETSKRSHEENVVKTALPMLFV